MDSRQTGQNLFGISQVLAIWLMIERVLGAICVCVLLFMAGLTGADVVARYMLNAPIQGAFELTEVLLVCLIFCAMPLATRTGSHVEVELWEPASRAGRGFRKALVTILGTGIFAGLAYQLAEHGQKLARRGSVTSSLDIPLSHIAYLAAVCCALSVVAVILANFYKDRG